MARDVTDATLIHSREDLVGWFEAGSKANGPFRVGTEHEKFPFYRADHTSVPYEGAAGRPGIRALLDGLRQSGAWEQIKDGDAIIGLADDTVGAAISLEPGGQFELSGAPYETIHETATELRGHLEATHQLGEALGIGFLGLGMSPAWSVAQTPMMPKQRYRIMKNYMPKVGTRGLDMMFRTCTVQANLDYASEADMVQKLRVSLNLQPVATTLFANSPFADGRPSGFLSGRSEIWRDTDNHRAGMLPFAFEPGMGFESYVDYALDVPLYFVKRGDTYHDVAGASFRDLMAGRLDALPGERATIADWANHMGSIFPEVRLKRYLEMRGADVGAPDMMIALPALFVGLLYDKTALDEAMQLTRGWTQDDRERARADVPRLALKATIAGRPVRDIAGDVLAIARGGLARRAMRDAQGRDETIYLAPLDDIVDSGLTRAERLLALYHGAWGGRIDPVFDATAL